MTNYEEYTFLLIGIPAYVMAGIIVDEKGIDRDSIKGGFLYIVLTTLFLPIFAAFVFLIRYIRA